MFFFFAYLFCMCCPIELVLYSDGWARTTFQTINIIPEILFFSFAQCLKNVNAGEYSELLHMIGHAVSICLEVCQPLKVI
jgi:hypothetical protein